jgi:hypothetical protein
MSLVLHKVVNVVVNVDLRKLISWPTCREMCIIMSDFKQWCNLLSVQGAIDGTHF